MSQDPLEPRKEFNEFRNTTACTDGGHTDSFVVAAIWCGPNWLVAGLAGIIAVLALLEFFAMGERARISCLPFWTCLAALWNFCAAMVRGAVGKHCQTWATCSMRRGLHESHSNWSCLYFLLGAAVIALASRRALRRGVFLGFGQRRGTCRHCPSVQRCRPSARRGRVGPELLLFTLVLVWVGDTAAYFVGRRLGRWKMSPQVSPQQDVGGGSCESPWCVAGGRRVRLLDQDSAGSHARNGRSRQHCRPGGRSIRIGFQTQRGREGFRNDPAGAWRNAGPN